MPSKTPKQARTMAAAAHDPAFAKKIGIPQSVAQDFNQADAAKNAASKKKPPNHLGDALRGKLY
jgi:hypothetical protein